MIQGYTAHGKYPYDTGTCIILKYHIYVHTIYLCITYLLDYIYVSSIYLLSASLLGPEHQLQEGRCGGFNEECMPHRLGYLNTWIQVGVTV